MPIEITKAMLRPFWPRATDAVLDGTIAAWPRVRDKYGLTTILRAAHFWGQITWECGGGTELRENGHYTAAGILRVFGVGVHSAKVTQAEADVLAEKCKTDGGRALFNRVYGVGNPVMAARLGNIDADDGWLFRGDGALNTTGRSSFARVGKAIGVDLVGNPEIGNDPGISLMIGAEEYVELGCLKFADADDTHTETVHINGGTKGLSGREDLIQRFKAAFGAATHAAVVTAPAVVAALAPVAAHAEVAAQSKLPALLLAGGSAIGVAGAAVPQSTFELPRLDLPHIDLMEFFMSPYLLLFGFVCFALLAALIADRIIRFNVTPGSNFMSAFENDAYVAFSYALMKLGLVLAAVQAWLTAYMPLFSDDGFLHFIHTFWPGQQINAVIEGVGVFLRAITIFKSTPLPTLKFVSVAAPAPTAIVVAAANAGAPQVVAAVPAAVQSGG